MMSNLSTSDTQECLNLVRRVGDWISNDDLDFTSRNIWVMDSYKSESVDVKISDQITLELKVVVNG